MELEIKNGNLMGDDAPLFSDVNFRVRSGETVCLMGRSRAGRTQLLRSLSGLRWLDSGFVSVDGALLTPQSASTLRRWMAYVPQDAPSAYATADELAASLLSLRANANGQSLAQRVADVREEWPSLGLAASLADKPLAEATPNQRHRMMMAVVARLSKPIVLIDAPVVAFDSAVAPLVETFIHGMAARGSAVVAVSDDQVFARSCARTIII